MRSPVLRVLKVELAGPPSLFSLCPSDVPFVSQVYFIKKIELENGKKSSSISSFCYLPML
jgi:hypothetical protein